MDLLIKKLMVKIEIPRYFLLKITDDFAHIQYCSGRCAQSVIKKNRCAQHSKSFFHLFFGLVGLFRTNKNKLIIELVLTVRYMLRMSSGTLPLDIDGFNFANLTCHFVLIGYIRSILHWSTIWHVILAKFKLPGNTKLSF